MAKTKQSVCISFSREKGKRAKEILDNSKNKSQLVVELLLFYKEATEHLDKGEEEIFYELRSFLKNIR